MSINPLRIFLAPFNWLDRLLSDKVGREAAKFQSEIMSQPDDRVYGLWNRDAVLELASQIQEEYPKTR